MIIQLKYKRTTFPKLSVLNNLEYTLCIKNTRLFRLLRTLKEVKFVNVRVILAYVLLFTQLYMSNKCIKSVVSLGLHYRGNRT